MIWHTRHKSLIERGGFWQVGLQDAIGGVGFEKQDTNAKSEE